MTTYYWIGTSPGGSGNWDNVNSWSLSSGGSSAGAVPTSSDAVIFDANSITSAGQTVTIRDSHTNACLSLDMSGVLNSPTLEWLSTVAFGFSTLLVWGNVTIPSSVAIGISFVSNAFGTLEIATTSTLTIACDLTVLSIIQIDGGTINLAHNLLGSVNVLGGTFNTNNYNITFKALSAQNSGTIFNAGSSTLTMIATTPTAPQLLVNGATWNAGTSLIQMQGSNGKLIGPATFYNIHVQATPVIFQSTMTWNNLMVDPGVDIKFEAGSTFTSSGVITAIGTPSQHITFESTTATSSWFINSTSNNVIVYYVNVSDSHAGGTTPFVDWSGSNNGNNVNWTFNTLTTTNRTITGVSHIIAANAITEINDVFSITMVSATVEGTIPTMTGVSATGIVWATHPGATLADSSQLVAYAVGPFFAPIAGLTGGTTYYVRSYVTISGVTSYGSVEISFSTPTTSPILVPVTDNLVGKYQFGLYDSSGNLIADLSGFITNRKVVITRNRPEEITFTVSLFVLENLANELHMSPLDFLQTGIQQIIVARKGVIICAGQLDYWEADFSDPDSPVVNIKAHGWLSLLSYRTVTTEYDGHDANYIARDLVTQTQALTNGDFGITLGHSATGTNTYAQKIFTEAVISDAIIQMSEEADGFDFNFTWDKIFNIYWPVIGVQQNFILFTYPGNIMSMNISSDSTKITNSLLGRGQGNANSQFQDTEVDLTSQTTYKLRQAIKDYPDVLSQDQLVNLTKAEILYYKNPLILHSITYDGSNVACPPIGSYSVGDQVRIFVKQLQLYSDLQSFFTIDQITIDLLDENDFEKITLSLNNAP